MRGRSKAEGWELTTAGERVRRTARIRRGWGVARVVAWGLAAVLVLVLWDRTEVRSYGGGWCARTVGGLVVCDERAAGWDR